jgi:hypothetical protein
MGIYLQPLLSIVSRKLVIPSPHSKALAGYRISASNQLKS